MLLFLPTPSRRGRPRASSTHASKTEFLPTPSRRGRRFLCLLMIGYSDFYPRPRVEGDVFIPNFSFPEVAISTHALTWRATVSGSRQHHPPAISTHALTWRATCRPFSWVAPIRNFYPRPHMEGDLFCKSVPYWVYISTHALTWRATFV